LLGVGGTPEGVISAAAMKCMGGTMQGRLWPRNDEERVKAVEQGYELEDILFVEDLCGGEQVFFAATGVTDGNLLEGVRYFGGGATTNSIVMRAESGTGESEPSLVLPQSFRVVKLSARVETVETREAKRKAETDLAVKIRKKYIRGDIFFLLPIVYRYRSREGFFYKVFSFFPFVFFLLGGLHCFFL
jgi:hypothetical protein